MCLYHTVEILLRGPGGKWLSGTRLAQYQGALLEDPKITIRTIQTINPTSLLPSSMEPPEYDYTEVIQMAYLTQSDL